MANVSLSSTLALDVTQGLLWGSTFLTADPLEALLERDEEEVSVEGALSPFSSSSSYAGASPHSPLPPLSPPAFLADKVEPDLLSLPWLSDELLDATIGVDGGKEDAFSGMDWMTEKLDLSEFDLESLETPSSPEDLLTSLECSMEQDAAPVCDSHLHTDEEMHTSPVKFEPASPVPSPSSLPPPSPTFTLDLGSEVDVSESKKPPQVPKLVISLTPPIVFLMAPKEESRPESPVSDSDSGIDSPSLPRPRGGSSRTKPYTPPPKPSSEPKPTAAKVKGAPDKKLKKMEQNKTAATRYRQKKRAEQEALSSECADLERRNKQLGDRAESISKEIQYLKDLMEEVRHAKGRKSQGGASRVA